MRGDGAGRTEGLKLFPASECDLRELLRVGRFSLMRWCMLASEGARSRDISRQVMREEDKRTRVEQEGQRRHRATSVAAVPPLAAGCAVVHLGYGVSGGSVLTINLFKVSLLPIQIQNFAGLWPAGGKNEKRV